jgi:hypothetical protein
MLSTVKVLFVAAACFILPSLGQATNAMSLSSDADTCVNLSGIYKKTVRMDPPYTELVESLLVIRQNGCSVSLAEKRVNGPNRFMQAWSAGLGLYSLPFNLVLGQNFGIYPNWPTTANSTEWIEHIGKGFWTKETWNKKGVELLHYVQSPIMGATYTKHVIEVTASGFAVTRFEASDDKLDWQEKPSAVSFEKIQDIAQLPAGFASVFDNTADDTADVSKRGIRMVPIMVTAEGFQIPQTEISSSYVRQCQFKDTYMFIKLDMPKIFIKSVIEMDPIFSEAVRKINQLSYDRTYYCSMRADIDGDNGSYALVPYEVEYCTELPPRYEEPRDCSLRLRQ